jgi:hypothetical protein
LHICFDMILICPFYLSVAFVGILCKTGQRHWVLGWVTKGWVALDPGSKDWEGRSCRGWGKSAHVNRIFPLEQGNLFFVGILFFFLFLLFQGSLSLGFYFKLYSPLHWTTDCAPCLIATPFIANLFLANLIKLPPTQKHPPP